MKRVQRRIACSRVAPSVPLAPRQEAPAPRIDYRPARR